MMKKLLYLLLLLPYVAFGAVGVENIGGTNNVGSGSSITLSSFTVTSANMLLVAVSYGNGSQSQPSDITWMGTSMTLVASSGAYSGGWAGVYWYSLTSPAAGTGAIIVNPNTPVNYAQLAVHAIGLTGVTSLGAASTNTGTSTNPSVTVTASASGDIVVSVISSDNEACSITPAGTQIFEAENVSSDTDHNSQYQTASGASHNAAWTCSASGTGWAASGVPAKGSGGGGTPVAVFLHHLKQQTVQ